MKLTSLSKRILDVLTTIITVVLLVLAVLLAGVRLFGYTPYAILSGSMEPEFPVGSVVYVKASPIEEIQIGDPITYILNEDLVVSTHRVVEIDLETELFKTKGDANNTVDGKPVHYNNVIGVVEYSLPYLGYVSVYIASKKGIALVIIIVSLMLISSLIKILRDDKKKEKIKRDIKR